MAQISWLVIPNRSSKPHIPFSPSGRRMACWKRPCEPVEILGCCYLYVETRKWRYIRDLSELPSEWVAKVRRFNETYYFADEDVILGYVAILNEDSTICSVIAIVLYGNKDDKLVVDFIDIDEWLRFVEQHSTQ